MSMMQQLKKSGVKINEDIQSDKSLTQQHFKEETDINNMVRKYLTKGVPMATNQRQPIYGDYTSLDFMQMRNSVADIEQTFAMLPAKIRNRFQNDPYQLVRFVENPENSEAAIKMGLLVDPNPPASTQPLTAEKPSESPKPDPEANPHKKA